MKIYLSGSSKHERDMAGHTLFKKSKESHFLVSTSINTRENSPRFMESSTSYISFKLFSVMSSSMSMADGNVYLADFGFPPVLGLPAPKSSFNF